MRRREDELVDQAAVADWSAGLSAGRNCFRPNWASSCSSGRKPTTPWGPQDKRDSRIVFIGRKLDAEELKRGFESCAQD